MNLRSQSITMSDILFTNAQDGFRGMRRFMMCLFKGMEVNEGKGKKGESEGSPFRNEISSPHIKTTMIYAKAGDAIKRRTIEKLEEGAQDGPKMVPLAFPVRDLEDVPKDEK